MITVREIHKSYGRVHAVKGVSFELERGQVAGLLGPNGAGKSTTIRMITGFLSPDAGTVEVAGVPMAKDREKARWQLGYLPESAASYHEMPVEAYLHYRARLFAMRRADRRRAIDRVIELCWLSSVRRRRIGQLSKGFRQRVGLATALVHDPQVLVLDEPSNGLDPTQISETRDLIRRLGQDRTMLVSSHILPEIERTCDRIIIMNRGEVRADGPPRELIARAAGKSGLIIEARVNADVATTTLHAVPGVSGVRVLASDGVWARLDITPTDRTPDLREPVAKAARENGWFVRELSPTNPTLEQVFFSLIDEAPARPAADDGRDDGRGDEPKPKKKPPPPERAKPLPRSIAGGGIGGGAGGAE